MKKLLAIDRFFVICGIFLFFLDVVVPTITTKERASSYGGLPFGRRKIGYIYRLPCNPLKGRADAYSMQQVDDF